VVEVAGESLARDREVKARISARASIPEYWLVDVERKCIKVYREPDAAQGCYQSRQVCSAVTEQTRGLREGAGSRRTFLDQEIRADGSQEAWTLGAPAAIVPRETLEMAGPRCGEKGENDRAGRDR
jgi:hypothetical protein